MRQGDRIRGKGEALIAVVVENSGQEVAECYVKRCFGGSKEAALEIRQTWRWDRIQRSSGIRVLNME